MEKKIDGPKTPLEDCKKPVASLVGPQKNVTQKINAYWESVKQGEESALDDQDGGDECTEGRVLPAFQMKAIVAAVQEKIFERMVGAYVDCPLVVSLNDANRLKVVRDGIGKTHLPFWGRVVPKSEAKGFFLFKTINDFLFVCQVIYYVLEN